MRITSRLLSFLVILVVLLFTTKSYAQHWPFYVLDGFGGVHAGGGAPAPPAGLPYFGFDIAKDIAFFPAAASDAIMVLDGFGGVHFAGIGAVAPLTPYFGFDIARAITYRNIPPRAANDAGVSPVDLPTTSSNFTVLESTLIIAPNDGFLLVIGTSFVGCFSAAGNDLSAVLTINVDGTTEPAAIMNMGIAVFDDCASGAGAQMTNNQTVHHLFPVSAGAHTVNLLARKRGGTGVARYLGRSLTAVFIDHDFQGRSVPEPGVVSPDATNATRAVGR